MSLSSFRYTSESFILCSCTWNIKHLCANISHAYILSTNFRPSSASVTINNRNLIGFIERTIGSSHCSHLIKVWGFFPPLFDLKKKKFWYLQFSAYSRMDSVPANLMLVPNHVDILTLPLQLCLVSVFLRHLPYSFLQDQGLQRC